MGYLSTIFRKLLCTVGGGCCGNADTALDSGFEVGFLLVSLILFFSVEILFLLPATESWVYMNFRLPTFGKLTFLFLAHNTFSLVSGISGLWHSVSWAPHLPQNIRLNEKTQPPFVRQHGE